MSSDVVCIDKNAAFTIQMLYSLHYNPEPEKCLINIERLKLLHPVYSVVHGLQLKLEVYTHYVKRKLNHTKILLIRIAKMISFC